VSQETIEDQLKSRWKTLLEVAIDQPRQTVQALDFIEAKSTKAQPVILECNDGREYVVKGQNAGRQIVNEQIVARLGLLLGAPIPETKIVEIPDELIKLEKKLAHIHSGTAHGSLYLRDTYFDRCLIATSEDVNRLRLALLAVLYGWAGANDQQYLFTNKPPRLIYSIDHGHFFPNSPNWTANDLATAQNAQLDPVLVSACNFTPLEIDQALEALVNINEGEIIDAVAYPPTEWGITIDERTMMLQYLIKRQIQLSTLRQANC
jgi:hypothetical protein